LNAAGYRTLAPDQRGYSPQAREPRRREYRRAELIADVLALADAAGAERFHVVGHDWGAAVAWGVAIEQPHRVRTLTALSVPHPAAFRRAVLTSVQALRSWYMAFFQLPRIPELTLGSRDLGSFKRNLIRSGLPKTFADTYTERLRQPGALTCAINWYRGMRVSDGKAVPVTVPTLLIWGDRDPFLHETGVRLTRRYVTGPFTLEVLHDEGHWIPERAPERVADLLLPHLARG
jgi:pimeloyl-ACP methyl ester carboxylesterase